MRIKQLKFLSLCDIILVSIVGGGKLTYKDLKNNKELIVCGSIANTHGYKGAVKLIPLCDDIDVIYGLGYLVTSDGVERDIENISVFKNMLIVSLEGITSMEDAEKLKATYVYARREDIPVEDGSFFIADLISLPVYDVDSGKLYGKIKSVDNFGASDIYTVKTEKGDVMIPAVAEFVKEIDLEKGVFIKPIEGMFDEI